MCFSVLSRLTSQTFRTQAIVALGQEKQEVLRLFTD